MAAYIQTIYLHNITCLGLKLGFYDWCTCQVHCPYTLIAHGPRLVIYKVYAIPSPTTGITLD